MRSNEKQKIIGCESSNKKQKFDEKEYFNQKLRINQLPEK
jgi:hypothetical protein